jgi:trehalose 6-phosphate phosphatase
VAVEATEDLLAPLRDALPSSAVLLDFDGTLAPIVKDPAAARPLPGVVDALLALHAGGALVAVLSGRPVAFLAEHLPAELLAVGLYGLERRVGGEVRVDPAAERWRSVVDDVVDRARVELSAGVEVEPKGLSLTLHVRRAPALADEARAWAEEVASATGLVARGAKRSTELHPPVALDKGTVADELLAGRTAACFIGDDLGDLPAFDAMDRFGAAGGHAVRILVRTSETAAELVGRADLEVEGPAGALEVLRRLCT